MDNVQVLVILILIRLIIPIGILVTIGEWERHREANYRLRDEYLKAPIFQTSVPR
jgi:hypothetical protein